MSYIYFVCKDTANFSKNKNLPGFSLRNFVDSEFLFIFASVNPINNVKSTSLWNYKRSSK